MQYLKAAIANDCRQRINLTIFCLLTISIFLLLLVADLIKLNLPFTVLLSMPVVYVLIRDLTDARKSLNDIYKHRFIKRLGHIGDIQNTIKSLDVDLVQPVSVFHNIQVPASLITQQGDLILTANWLVITSNRYFDAIRCIDIVCIYSSHFSTSRGSRNIFHVLDMYGIDHNFYFPNYKRPDMANLQHAIYLQAPWAIAYNKEFQKDWMNNRPAILDFVERFKVQNPDLIRRL